MFVRARWAQGCQDPDLLSLPQDPCLRRGLLPLLPKAESPGKHTQPSSGGRGDGGATPEPPQVRATRPRGRARRGTVGQTLTSSLHVVAWAYFCLVWLILAGCSRPIMPRFSTRLFRPRNVLSVSQAENQKPPLWLAVLRLRAATHLFRFLLVYICRPMTC